MTPVDQPEWRGVTTVTDRTQWEGALFGRRPRWEPWPALEQRHRAVVRLERDLGEAVEVAQALRDATEGLWCAVMREEFRRAVDHFLLMARGGVGDEGFEPETVLVELRRLVRLCDAVLGCVGILDDYDALQLARDRAVNVLDRNARSGSRRD